MKASDLTIKLYADGADKNGMLEMYKNPLVKGFTTNPSLMRKAGVTDYKAYAAEMLRLIPDRSISFEVLADDMEGMEEQAYEIASWGKNVSVKIPVLNTKGESTAKLIKKLSAQGISLNLTVIFTLDQVKEVVENLTPTSHAIVSVFAGRVADTGVDPLPLMQESLQLLKHLPKAELLWASPREILNIVQADQMGCHIITATNDMISKLNLLGKDLHGYSLEGVQVFYRDTQAAGFQVVTQAEKI